MLGSQPVSRPLWRGAWALALALALGAGCVNDEPSGGSEPGSARWALEPDFAPVVGLCPATDDWGSWAQTPLSTWDADVQPIIQWIIDETGISCSTYSGHSPSIGRAADWRPSSREEGTRLANWLQDHITGEAYPLGLYYVMWQAQIGFSDEIRDVEDRGSFTANHCDHVHISFHDTVDLSPVDVEPWDGATEPDAGPPTDASPPTDGAPPDGGAPPEDAAPPDAPATPEDASPDAGPPPDGGDPPPPPEPDGFEQPIGGLVGGCSVTATRREPTAWLAALLRPLAVATGR